MNAQVGTPKEILLSLALLLSAGSVMAQGTVIFNNRIVGTLITHIYGPYPADPGRAQAGNGPGDYPAGTTDWTGWTPLSGSGFTAQLWAAPGADQPESSLQPATPSTTFRTGAGAGWVVSVPRVALPGVPYDAPVATVTVRAWDNEGGAVSSWDEAVSANAIRGEAPLFNLAAIGDGFGGPALVGLQSFNIANVPEPSTLALAGLSVALLLLVRGGIGVTWLNHTIQRMRASRSVERPFRCQWRLAPTADGDRSP